MEGDVNSSATVSSGGGANEENGIDVMADSFFFPLTSGVIASLATLDGRKASPLVDAFSTEAFVHSFPTSSVHALPLRMLIAE